MRRDEIIKLIEEAARTNQTELDLSWNNLSELPAEITQLANLTTLDLRGNQLTELPAEITQLAKLTTLDLSGNQLSDLPAEITQLTKLTTLNLSKNLLSELPAEITQLTKLTTLYLSHDQLTENQLTELPAEIAQLMNLNTLDLRGNQLTELPAEIGQLVNLTTLNLSVNQLSELPAEITQLVNLTTLNLRGNQLSELPAEIGQLANLTTLHLWENELSELPAEIGQLANLTTLDLWGNQLSELPAEITQLVKLTTLYLSGNQLSELPAEITQLANLTTLDLSENKLSDLPAEITQLANLTTLNLSGNQMSELPAEITALVNLTQLFLSENQMSELPAEITQLSNLTTLDLEENPLKSPPPEIAGQGVQAIFEYFKSLEAEKQPLNEVKVLLVGDGGAGKTSLVKRLLGEKFDNNEPQTHGINIKKWEIIDGDDKIKVHSWDFGGQEIMHATHQFFLSKRSLYVLVLDGRKEEKTEYWLKHIESFGGDSPILVVINKIDENPSFDVNRSFLEDKYKGIKSFHRVSCKENKGITSFDEILTDELTKVELRQEPFAKNWFNVKTKLEDMKDNFISYETFQDLCIQENITGESAQDTLIGFLNDLGIILHFKDFQLKHTHVLEPKWVTGAVYRIINSEKVAKNNGLLKLESLAEILKKEKETDYFYPQDKHKYIIDLMKKFELCYEIEPDYILIPDLLEIQEPKFDFDYSSSLKFLIDYDFLPKSVMPRFIVKMHKDIKDNLRWRTGVVLEDATFNSTAVVKADEND
ncbi:MAG: leucine-rich repeat domain-containing protein, partial [Desulfobacterales bacterium]|nr:leucine-rich repeat domain-containing protein [Desulfobacterales bacterium]